jgi:hypothetical protein
MIALVQKTVCLEEACPTSFFLSRRVWRTFTNWQVRAPAQVWWGACTHSAIGADWGGSDLVYPVFVTADGLKIEVADCDFDYVTEDSQTLRHVARPRD